MALKLENGWQAVTIHDEPLGQISHWVSETGAAVVQLDPLHDSVGPLSQLRVAVHDPFDTGHRVITPLQLRN